jgi:hypothetical protein
MYTVTQYREGKRASGNLVFNFKMNTEDYGKACQLPGFKKWDGYKLIFRPVLANIKYILETWPSTEWLDGSDSFLETIRALERDANKVIQLKTGPLPASKGNGYQYKRLPREHQRRALLMSWDKRAFALLMEQRTGKTKVIIDNAAHLFKLGKLHTLVVVTINGVHRNWIENEVPEDLPDWCNRECWFMRGGLSKRDEDQFKKTLAAKNTLRIFSFNVEALSRDGKARDLFELAIGDGKGVMLAIDESSDCIKNYDAKRTKYILKFGGKAEYRRILTGTQSPEGRADELFPQYKFLDEDIFGLDTITAFRARYCQEITMEVDGREVTTFRTDFKRIDELRQIIEGHSYRVRRADCMDLPPKVYKRWPVELSKEQRRLYDELQSEYTTIHEGKTLSAALAMTRALRLQQIVCGWFPMDEPELIDGETWRNIIPIAGVNNRLEALKDILRTNEDSKAIIWARFRPDLELIQKTLGERAVSYHGGINPDQKAKNYRAFQHDKDIQWIIANQSSAGRGLTMTAATLLVYYSNSFRLVDRLQSEDRAEGDEKKRDSTLVIDLEADRTVDRKIIRRLKGKKDVADLINGDPKSLFMEID